MKWRLYEVECYHGTSTMVLLVDVIARSYLDAVAKVRRMGYTPNIYQ